MTDADDYDEDGYDELWCDCMQAFWNDTGVEDLRIYHPHTFVATGMSWFRFSGYPTPEQDVLFSSMHVEQ